MRPPEKSKSFIEEGTSDWTGLVKSQEETTIALQGMLAALETACAGQSPLAS